MNSSSSIRASIVIPTRSRPGYLAATLASIAPQATAADVEVLVIDDAGATAEGRAMAERFGARYEPHPGPLGLNVARNSGVERSRGELIVFVDDDIEACPGWLSALLVAADARPDVAVFAGHIVARLEGRAPRSCGREAPPVTTLELGDMDTETRYAWGTNMAIRRAALEQVGPFDVSLRHGGDEQEWQERLRERQPDARVLYVAQATVEHRRIPADSRLRRLARAAYARGKAARRFDRHAGRAPALRRELATLAGCAGHVLRRRCPAGITMVTHSAGRVREALVERTRGDAAPTTSGSGDMTGSGGTTAHGGITADGGVSDFLSGESGTVGGLHGVLRELRDRGVDAFEVASGERFRLRRAARSEPPQRRVLVVGVVRPEHRSLAEGVRTELLRSRHEVELGTCPPDGRGKFENVNRLLGEHPPQSHDWLLVVDDDIELPRGFLDRFLFLCERFSLQLAQPAHRLNSHAAWPVTRRRSGSVVRETGFVEIGPVTAFAQRTFATLLPFPQLRMGWGLDAHWAALAREQGWRCGVLDAVAIRHRAAPAADGYSRERAIAEAREFLAERPYLSAYETQRTLTTHRRF